MTLLMLCLLTGGLTAEAKLLNGDAPRGELQSLTTDGVSLLVNGQPQSFPRSALQRVEVIPTGEPPTAAESFVQLTDGSVVACDSLVMSADKAVGKGPTSWSAPLSSVRAMSFLSKDAPLRSQWEEIAAKRRANDTLVIRRESNLDYLTGIVTHFDEENIRFEYNGREIPVPLARSAGFVLARKAVEYPPPRVRVRSRQGSEWLCETVRLEDERLRFTTTSKVDFELPLASVHSVVFPELSATFLADLDATSERYEPYFSSKLLADTLARHMLPQRNRSFDGVVLRVADRESVSGWRQFGSGLAMHSKSELVYRLAGRYRRFRTTLGLDPRADERANAEFILYGDDQALFRQTIEASAAPVDLDIDVTNVLRLRLVVDFGKNLDIGDRVHLGDARLTK